MVVVTLAGFVCTMFLLAALGFALEEAEETPTQAAQPTEENDPPAGRRSSPDGASADPEAGPDGGRAPTATTAPATTEPPPPPTTAPPPPPLEGNGPSVVDITKSDEPLLAYIRANEAGRFCAVTSFDAAGEQLNLLVNTTDPYEGLRPVDFEVGEHTARFQVECQGAWRIELRHLDTAVGVGAGETRAHRGDDVFLVRDADTLTISGNAAGRFMAVVAYGTDGDIDLLVNTTDPYQGEVISPTTAVLVVEAMGDWSVTVNGP